MAVLVWTLYPVGILRASIGFTFAAHCHLLSRMGLWQSRFFLSVLRNRPVQAVLFGVDL